MNHRLEGHVSIVVGASSGMGMATARALASAGAKVALAHGTFREEQKNGIRTTVLFPGLCDTPLVLKRPVPRPPDVMAKALKPEDVAEACLFVASLPPRAVVATGVPVAAIVPGQGVRLEGGELIAVPVVVSNADPARTARLLGDAADPLWRAEVDAVPNRGCTLKLSVALRELPGFTARRRIGITGGHIFHGECLPRYMWDRRLSCRTPMPGVYLCGAGTHPGGSVIAVNGRNAVMAVLAGRGAGQN